MTTAAEGADTPVEPAHEALRDLHARAGTFGDAPKKGCCPSRIGADLATLAAAPRRAGVATGRDSTCCTPSPAANLPGWAQHEEKYKDLARSVSGPNELEARLGPRRPQAVGAGQDAIRRIRRRGRRFPLEVTAFVGEKVCNTESVLVDGIRATWIYSEFVTDAPFDTLAGWVDPRSWPKRSPLHVQEDGG